MIAAATAVLQALVALGGALWIIAGVVRQKLVWHVALAAGGQLGGAAGVEVGGAEGPRLGLDRLVVEARAPAADQSPRLAACRVRIALALKDLKAEEGENLERGR